MSDTEDSSHSETEYITIKETPKRAKRNTRFAALVEKEVSKTKETSKRVVAGRKAKKAAEEAVGQHGGETKPVAPLPVPKPAERHESGPGQSEMLEMIRGLHAKLETLQKEPPVVPAVMPPKAARKPRAPKEPKAAPKEPKAPKREPREPVVPIVPVAAPRKPLTRDEAICALFFS
jgi:hypothetical protein